MADMKKSPESNQQHNQSFVGKTEVSDPNARPANSKPLIFPKSKSEPNSPNKKIESATDRNLSSLFFPSLNYGEPVKVEKDEKDEIKKIKKHMSDDDEEIVIIQESSASNTSKTALVDSSAETVHSKRRKKPRIDPPTMMANPTPTMPPVVFNYVPAPQPLNPPPLWDMIIHFPPILAKDRLKFEEVMKRWRWHKIDDVKLPLVERGMMDLVPASVVHVKLLSQFAPNVIQNIPSQALPKLMSYKMTTVEAWMLNIINAGKCRFDLGYQIFVVNDDLVEIHAIERYYYAIKRIHLEQLLMTYNSELPSGSLFENVNLVRAIFDLRQKIIDEIQKIDNMSFG